MNKINLNTLRLQNLLVMIIMLVGMLLVGSGNNNVSAQAIQCKTVEYACWGRSVPIKNIKCDEVYEREVRVCDDRCDCTSEIDPSLEPVTEDGSIGGEIQGERTQLALEEEGAGAVDTGDGTVPGDCCCTVTEYSCNFCIEGKIFPYPERPEGRHGDADKCPTDDDFGQADGTGTTGGRDGKSENHDWYDYDRAGIINVAPIQFGEITPIPTPTATPPWTATPVPTEESDPPLTPIAAPTATPTGPMPTAGWPTHTPTPTLIPSPVPTPIPGSPCGWPVGPNTGTADGQLRRVTAACDNGDYPEDGDLVYSSTHDGYPAIDIGTGPLGASGQPTVNSTQAGMAYWCVENNEVINPNALSYGVYVIVEGADYSTIYAHLDASESLIPGFDLPSYYGNIAPQPGDPACEPSDLCYEPEHCLLQSRTVSAGEGLGVIGLTGATNGYHLHYEVWDSSNVTIDNYSGVCPANYMDYSASACGGDQPNAFNNLFQVFAQAWTTIRNFISAINPFSNNTNLAFQP